MNDELVALYDDDVPPEGIAHVAISVFPNTQARFRNFSLRAIRTDR